MLIAKLQKLSSLGCGGWGAVVFTGRSRLFQANPGPVFRLNLLKLLSKFTSPCFPVLLDSVDARFLGWRGTMRPENRTLQELFIVLTACTYLPNATSPLILMGVRNNHTPYGYLTFHLIVLAYQRWMSVAEKLWSVWNRTGRSRLIENYLYQSAIEAVGIYLSNLVLRFWTATWTLISKMWNIFSDQIICLK